MTTPNIAPQGAVREKILGAIGLALKARKCVTGTEMCVERIRTGRGTLLIVASDVSSNTYKRLTDAACAHKIPFVTADVSKRSLADIAGKKSDTAAVLFIDEGFANIIRKLDVEIHTTNTEVLK